MNRISRKTEAVLNSLSLNPPDVDEGKHMTLEGYLSTPPDFLVGMGDFDMPYDAITLLAIYTHAKAHISGRKDYDAYMTSAFNVLGVDYFENSQFEEFVFWVYRYFHQALLHGHWIDPDTDFIDLIVLLTNAYVYGRPVYKLPVDEAKFLIEEMAHYSTKYGSHWSFSEYQFTKRYQQLYRVITIYNTLVNFSYDEQTKLFNSGYHLPPHLWNTDGTPSDYLEDDEDLYRLREYVSAQRLDSERYQHLAEERWFAMEYVVDGNIDDMPFIDTCHREEIPDQWYLMAEEYLEINDSYPEYFSSRLHEEYDHLVRYYGTNKDCINITPPDYILKGNGNMASLGSRYANKELRTNARKVSEGTRRVSKSASGARRTSRKSRVSEIAVDDIDSFTTKLPMIRKIMADMSDTQFLEVDAILEDITSNVASDNLIDYVNHHLFMAATINEHYLDALDGDSEEEVSRVRPIRRSASTESPRTARRSRTNRTEPEGPANMPDIMDAFNKQKPKDDEKVAEVETPVEIEEDFDVNLINTTSTNFLNKLQYHSDNGLPTDVITIYKAVKQDAADAAYEKLQQERKAHQEYLDDDSIEHELTGLVIKDELRKEPTVVVDKPEEVSHVSEEPVEAEKAVEPLIPEPKGGELLFNDETSEITYEPLNRLIGTKWPILTQPDLRIVLVERCYMENFDNIFDHEGHEAMVAKDVCYFADKQVFDNTGFTELAENEMCPVVGTQFYWAHIHFGGVRSDLLLDRAVALDFDDGSESITGEKTTLIYKYTDVKEIYPHILLTNLVKVPAVEEATHTVWLRFDIFGKWIYTVLPKSEEEMKDYQAHQNHPDWVDAENNQEVPDYIALTGGYSNDLAGTVNPTIAEDKFGLTDEMLTARDATTVVANDIETAILDAEVIYRKSHPTVNFDKQILEVTYAEKKSFFIPSKEIEKVRKRIEFFNELDSNARKRLTLTDIMDNLPAVGKGKAYLMGMATRYANDLLKYGVGTDVRVNDLYTDWESLEAAVVKREGDSLISVIGATIERIKIFLVSIICDCEISQIEFETSTEFEANNELVDTEDWYLDVSINNTVTSVPWGLKAMSLNAQDLGHGMIVYKESELYNAIDSVFKRTVTGGGIREHAMLLNDGNIVYLMRSPSGVKNYMIYN